MKFLWLAGLVAGTPLLLNAQPVEKKLAESELLTSAARDYYLEGPSIYKATPTSGNLMAEDFNGDGLLDFAVVANDKSLLKLYLQNEDALLDDRRFTERDISLDRAIRSAVAADADGDGRTDVIIAASPPRLAVMYQNDDGVLESPEETDLQADRLILGDLTNDGRDDLLIIHENSYQILEGTRRGFEMEPIETFFSTGDPASPPMILDFDGDGRNDIVYHNSQRFEELVIRLQTPEGGFPSEFRLKTAVLRMAAPLPSTRRGEGGTIAAIQNNTRHLAQIGALEREAGGTESANAPSPIHTFAFDPDTEANEPLTVTADVDGDGRLDFLVGSPESSSLRLLRQTKTGALTQSIHPSLQGIDSISAFPAMRGEPVPLILFSPEENAIAFLKYDEETGALPFPAILPIPGQPSAATLIHRGEDEDPLLAVILEEEKDGERQMRLHGFPVSRDGNLGEATELMSPEDATAEFSNRDIIGMDAFDVNRDGRLDLAVYADFQPAALYLQGDTSEFAPLQATSGILEGLLASTTPGDLSAVFLDDEHSSVLALKEPFARVFSIDENRNVVIEHQFNGTNSNARIIAAAVGDSIAGDGLEAALLDRNNRVITVYTMRDENWILERDIPLNDVNYESLGLADLDGDGAQDYVLTAEDRISVIYSQPYSQALTVISSAQTPVEEGGYGEVYTVDLIPGDPGLELVAIEASENLMEIFQLGEDEEERPALNRFYQFKMYDRQGSLSGRGNLDRPMEPRDLLAVDFFEDGEPEILCLMHDNIVIYEPAEKPNL